MKCEKIDYDFDVAKNYDKDRESEEHWSMENCFIKNYFSDRTPEVILDLPVGTGRFLSNYPSSSNVFGVDISEYMLNEARSHISESSKVSLLLGDAQNIDSFKDNSVDTIVCFRLMHLIEPQKRLTILREFSRILKGELLLQVYLTRPKKMLVFRIIKKIFNTFKRFFLFKESVTKPWFHIQAYDISSIEISSLLGNSGLKIANKTKLCDYGYQEVIVFTLVKA